MSAYSDWKCGAIPDELYAFCANHEIGADHGEDSYDDYYDDESVELYAKQDHTHAEIMKHMIECIAYSVTENTKITL